jgi:hypothetical protein
MQSELYVTLSAQVALERRLTTLASNIANQSTPGYKAEEVDFKTLISRVGDTPIAYVSPGDTYISPRPGVPVKTDIRHGNKLTYCNRKTISKAERCSLTKNLTTGRGFGGFRQPKGAHRIQPITTLCAHMDRWATSRRRQRASYPHWPRGRLRNPGQVRCPRGLRGRQCTNIRGGPVSGGRSPVRAGIREMPGLG